MKITPVSSTNTIAPGIDAQGSRIAELRSVKMQTNATPGAAQRPTDEELSKLPNNEDKPEPVVEATQPLSPQFAALAKQRRALQQERRALEDAKKAHEIAKQGSDAVPLTRLKSDPLSVLLEAGVTYDELAQAITNNPVNPEMNALKNEINSLKEGIDKRFTEQEEQQIQNYLSQQQREATQIVANDEKYELVKATGSIDKAIEYIEATYRKTGEVKDLKETLERVENYLYKEQQKLANLKKMRSLFSEQTPQPPVQAQQQRAPGMTTLTNKHTASPLMDRKARALAAFWGQKK